MRIAIDIDNTLVDYRKAVLGYLKKSNIELGDLSKDKKMIEIKDYIKNNLDDIFWQKTQAHIYSLKNNEINFYEDCAKFIKDSFYRNAEIYLISHKTKYGMHKSRNIDIRSIAGKRIINWLVKNDLSICIKALIFTDTFDEKIRYLSLIDPSIIIDDLLDIHKEFINIKGSDKRNNYKNVLFEGNSSTSYISEVDGIIYSNSWMKIKNYIFS